MLALLAAVAFAVELLFSPDTGDYSLTLVGLVLLSLHFVFTDGWGVSFNRRP
jgi:hypothetical protein